MHQVLETDHLKTAKTGKARPDEGQRRNSFDAIRIIAAFGVFFGHQLGLAGGYEPHVGRIAFSSMALYVFFSLGGYLIYQSLARDSTVYRYAMARALRLCPGYFVNVLFCVALGAAITTLPLAEFLSSSDTLKYIGINTSMVLTPTQFILPGVLEASRWRPINGSMWTIKYELLVYLAPFILYHVSGVRYRKYVLGVAAFLLILNYVYCITRTDMPQGLAFFAEYNYYNLSRLFFPFFFGAWLAACEPLALRWRLSLFGLAIALIAAFYDTEVVQLGTIMLVSLIVIELGKSPLLYLSIHRRIGDLSYGVFLYAYPIQNYIWTYQSQGRSFYTVTFITVLVIFACALLSWHLVEKPMLARKPPPARDAPLARPVPAPA